MATNNVRASTASTIVSILTAVNAAAGSVVKTIDSASTGIDMLDSYVQKAKKQQLAAHKEENHNFLKNLKLDSAMDQAKRELVITKSLRTDADLAQLFKQNMAELDELFAETTA